MPKFTCVLNKKKGKSWLANSPHTFMQKFTKHMLPRLGDVTPKQLAKFKVAVEVDIPYYLNTMRGMREDEEGGMMDHMKEGMIQHLLYEHEKKLIDQFKNSALSDEEKDDWITTRMQEYKEGLLDLSWKEMRRLYEE